MIPRVYLDTVITSGRISRDLKPDEEMIAVDQICALHDAGRIKIVTSKMSRIEQDRTKDSAVREAFAARAHEVSAVPADHRLLGFHSMDMGHRGFISYPLISDIVDEDLFAKLLALGLKDADAKHVMYSANSENDCQYFITLDNRDLLPRRTEIEAAVPHLRILRPTEFIAEFGAP